MQCYIKGNQRIWYDDTLLSVPPEQCCEPGFWQAQQQVIGQAEGRGITWFVQLDSLQGALRHYRRGGLFGRLVKDRYLFAGWEKSRSYQEFQLLLHLAHSGVNVPRPIAARTRRHLLSYSADLLSEKIPQAQDLVAVLQKQALVADTYQCIGREIRKMHDCQVNHTDLNIHNLLLDARGKVWIIDFDKCKQSSGEAWKQANLDRLLRSFRKEKGKRDINWQESEFQALLAGYQE
jgi:3-deoxy-D-manno-octulosonic acid kinase